jgi:hypothetical protein
MGVRITWPDFLTGFNVLPFLIWRRHPCPVFPSFENGDWKARQNHRRESLRHVIIQCALVFALFRMAMTLASFWTKASR